MGGRSRVDDSAPAASSECRAHGAGVRAGAVALVLTAACGLGARADLEESITRAPSRADDGVVAGTITVESRFVEAPDPGSGGIGLPAGAEGFEIPEGGVPIATDSARFELDLATFRAALTRHGAQTPFVLVDDLVLFGRRGGVPATDARPWVRLDLADLATGGGELSPFEDAAQAIAALHPALVADLAAGTLTGSIEDVGVETVAGAETRRYDVNISIEKALGDVRRSRYPEERRETVDDLIELLGVDGDLHPAQVWLDADGRLRRFSVALTQRPVTRVEFALAVTMDFETYGDTFEHVLPTPQEVLTVDTVVRFIRTVAFSGEDSDA